MRLLEKRIVFVLLAHRGFTEGATAVSWHDYLVQGKGQCNVNIIMSDSISIVFILKRLSKLFNKKS